MLASGSFSCGYLVTNICIHVKGSNHRFPFEQVPHRILDLRKLLAMIQLGVLLGIPKADAQNPLGLCIRDEHDLVDKAALSFQDWNNFLVDTACEFFGFSGFGRELNYACEHVLLLSLVRGERKPACLANTPQRGLYLVALRLVLFSIPQRKFPQSELRSPRTHRCTH